MLNSYAFASSRIKIKSLYSTINKRKKISAYPIKPENTVFYQKIIKIQLFDLKRAILNRYAYESKKYRNDKFRKNQKLNKFLRSVKNWHFNKNTENSHF